MKAIRFKGFMFAGLMLIFSNLACAQVYKFRTTSFSFKYKTNDYNWSNWSDWEETSLIVVLDVDDERVKIFSQEIQVYDIIKNEGDYIDQDGDDVWSLYCVNEDGSTCRLRFIWLKQASDRLQLYVEFNDMMWVYELRSID